MKKSSKSSASHPPLTMDRFPLCLFSENPDARIGTTILNLPTLASAKQLLKKQKKRDKEKEAGKPKRPLSAYNLFFQKTRGDILSEMPTRPEGKPRRSHGKIGFATLARSIAARWKSIDPKDKAIFDKIAAEDKIRYSREMRQWKTKRVRQEEEEAAAAHLQKEAVRRTNSSSVTELDDSTDSSLDLALKASGISHQKQQGIAEFPSVLPGGGFLLPNKVDTASPLLQNIRVPTMSLTDLLRTPSRSNHDHHHHPSLAEAVRATNTLAGLQMQPMLMPPSVAPDISDLAAKLDRESTDLFLTMFHG